jgi:hypothetical protein
MQNYIVMITLYHIKQKNQALTRKIDCNFELSPSTNRQL